MTMEPKQHLSSTQILTGRVFNRLQQFHALPQGLKDEVARLETHITTIQNEVFAKHHTLQLKSMRGVRYKPLLETVYEWVLDQESPKVPEPVTAADPDQGTATTSTTTTADAPGAPPTAKAPEQTQSVPVDTSGVAAASTAIPVAPTAPLSPAVITEEISVTSDEEADAKRAAEEATKSERVAHAKKLIDALVLKGYITPNKEDKSVAPTTTEEFDFKDLDLLVPLATAITGLTIPTTTVWDLVDGTVFAAMLKRRAGLLAPLTSGKDVYVLVNVRAHSVTMFESDVAREPIRIFEAALSSVTHDKSHYENGVKLWDETDAELFNTASIRERDAFVAALEAVGVTFREAFPIQDHHAKPANFNTSHTYTVEEVTDAASNAVPLDDVSDKFKAHVPARTEANDDDKSSETEPALKIDTIAEKEKRVEFAEATTKPKREQEQSAVEKSETAPVAPSGLTTTTTTSETVGDNNRENTMTVKDDAAVPTRPRTQSIDYGKRSPTATAETTTKMAAPPKHDETSSSSPTESSSSSYTAHGSNLFGEDPAVAQQKADKVFRFDEPLPATKTAGSPPKSNYFGHSITSNATKANDVNATKPSAPAP